MVTGGGWAIPAGEKPDWGFGKVEEVPRKVLARGIEVWWPEEGDRQKGETGGASARPPLGSGWSEEEERNDKWVPHPSR